MGAYAGGGVPSEARKWLLFDEICEDEGLCGWLQINATLLSSDGKTDEVVLAINAASAALTTSDIPWTGECTAAGELHHSNCGHRL